MDHHPTDREILSLIMNFTSGPARETLHTHIRACEGCRTRYERACSLINSYAPGDVPLPEDVRRRILASHSQIMETKNRNAGYSFRNIWKPVLAGAFLIIVIFISALFFRKTYFPDPGTSLTLAISFLRGDILIDGKKGNTSSRIDKDRILEVRGDSGVELDCGGYGKIRIAGDSLLRVGRAFIDKDGTVEFQFILEKGMLHSRFDRHPAGLRYGYVTPAAEIIPSGTEFIITATIERTVVLMKKGTVEIRSKKTGESVMALSGTKVIISHTISSLSMEGGDLLLIKKFDLLFREENNGEKSENTPYGKEGPSRDREQKNSSNGSPDITKKTDENQAEKSGYDGSPDRKELRKDIRDGKQDIRGMRRKGR
jgi:hypothetical protein